MPPGVLFALGAYALYSCCDAITKGLGSGLSVYEIAFFATLFSLAPAIAAKAKGDDWLRLWRIKNPGLLHLRGVSGVIGNLCIIYAFTSIPLAEVYSIAFLAPIFIVIISVQVLGEKVSLPRWMLLAACFAGVLIVVRPGFRELSLGHLAAVVAAFCGAITTTILRRIANEEARSSLIGIASIYILVVNGVLMLATGNYGWLTWQELVGLLTIGGLGGTANLLFIAATRSAPASIIAPFQYSQIFWAIIFGAVFYKEFPVPIAYVGLLVVVVAGIVNVLSDETRIRIFSRLSPGGAGPSLIRESESAATDATLESSIAGATEATSKR
jgi:drug/metabolite transporter (DMT)-like permease